MTHTHSPLFCSLCYREIFPHSAYLSLPQSPDKSANCLCRDCTEELSLFEILELLSVSSVIELLSCYSDLVKVAI